MKAKGTHTVIILKGTKGRTLPTRDIVKGPQNALIFRLCIIVTVIVMKFGMIILTMSCYACCEFRSTPTSGVGGLAMSITILSHQKIILYLTSSLQNCR